MEQQRLAEYGAGGPSFDADPDEGAVTVTSTGSDLDLPERKAALIECDCSICADPTTITVCTTEAHRLLQLDYTPE